MRRNLEKENTNDLIKQMKWHADNIKNGIEDLENASIRSGRLSKVEALKDALDNIIDSEDEKQIKEIAIVLYHRIASY